MNNIESKGEGMASERKSKKPKRNQSKWSVPEDLLVGFRERKRELNIPVTQSVEDGLRYAMAHKREWWRP
jgi:hypothetical protein